MDRVGGGGVPVYQEYMSPVLDVCRREDRPITIEELDQLVIAAMKLPQAIAAIPHDTEKPDRSEVSYRIAWSRSYLKKAGLLENPNRGLWSISEQGRAAGQIDAHSLASGIAQASKTSSASKSAAEDSEADGEDDEVDEELTTARIGDELGRQLLAVHEKLATAGQLLTTEEATRCYRRFRELFKPDVLAGLDGEALLTKMHGRGTKDSLVYWLEFKDDDEFPARFGSISGGSALKFGIYQASDTGQWMTGSGRQQVRLTTEEAVAKARGQRDQLVAGAKVLAANATPSAIDYSALQDAMVAAAPDLAETSWGHKYFALLFPTIVEAFHGADYQLHQLYKLLKLPGRGRYENARIFVGVARQLDLTLLDFTTTLYRRHGGPHRYWRVGTTSDQGSQWENMKTNGFAAVGWDAVGDLSDLATDQTGKQIIRERVEREYPGDASTVTKAANQLFQFAHGALEGDVVLAMEGTRVRGIGRVVSGYSFTPNDGPFPHRRGVQWLRLGDWKLPRMEGLRTTFVPIRKTLNIVETEARLLGTPANAPPPPEPTGKKSVAPSFSPLTGIAGRIEAVLQRKRQVILYGPPGTGKTYWAERAVEELAARAWFGVDASLMDSQKRNELREAGAVEMCSFHAAYGYEDFLEGFRPIEKNGALTFELRDGVFKRLCARAQKNRKPHFLIIDEINRGDIPRIFGELLTVLEREKRGRPITLPMSAAAFAVPDNVYVIGTMNTADRSIALLDAALRRRFGFVELLPDSTTLAGVSVGGLPLGPWLDELNRRVVQHAGRDARHLQVGHSYLLPGGAAVREVARFVEILRDDIIPLLEEYCYEDFEALERILGPTIVQRGKKSIDTSLFDPIKHGDLIQAILSAFENITATREAVEADVEPIDGFDDPDEVEAGA